MFGRGLYRAVSTIPGAPGTDGEGPVSRPPTSLAVSVADSVLSPRPHASLPCRLPASCPFQGTVGT